MQRSKKYRFTLAMSLSALLFSTPALAQDPLPTSPTPMPFNAAAPAQTGTPTDAPKDGTSPPRTPEGRAELLLSGYHQPPSKSVLDAGLEEPKKVLMKFARDESILPLRRQRALEALVYYADAEVEALYRDLLKDEQSAEMVRHRVMPLLASSFPKTALSALRPFLAHPELQYRLSAIDAVRRIPGEAARQALQSAAKSETQKVAQQRLAQYLRVAR